MSLRRNIARVVLATRCMSCATEPASPAPQAAAAPTIQREAPEASAAARPAVTEATPASDDVNRARSAVLGSITFQGDGFDPVRLVKAVNAVQRLGQSSALATLASSAPGSDGDEAERARLVARLAFVPKPGSEPLPTLRLGQTGIELAEDPAPWPLLPLVLSDDLPFLLLEAVLLGGVGIDPRSDLPRIERLGVLRAKPLAPGNPRDAVDHLLSSPSWQHAVAPGSQAAARRLVYLQALQAAAPLPGVLAARQELRATGAGTADAVWARLRGTLDFGALSWSDTAQQYTVSRVPSP